MYSWLLPISRFQEAENAGGRKSSLGKPECVKQKHCLQTRSQSSFHSPTSIAEAKRFRVVHLSKLFLEVYLSPLRPPVLSKEQTHTSQSLRSKKHILRNLCCTRGSASCTALPATLCCHSAAHRERDEPQNYFIQGSKCEFPLGKAETEEDSAFYT